MPSSAGATSSRPSRLCAPEWLAAHGLAILSGLVVVVVVSSLVLGLTTAWSVGDAGTLGPILGAGLAYLPAELVLAGLALALFGLRPRALPLAWAAYATAGCVAVGAPVGSGSRP